MKAQVKDTPLEESEESLECKYEKLSEAVVRLIDNCSLLEDCRQEGSALRRKIEGLEKLKNEVVAEIASKGGLEKTTFCHGSGKVYEVEIRQDGVFWLVCEVEIVDL